MGLQKSWVGHQSRKVKWYKMQVIFLKSDKLEGVKGRKKRLFTYFLTNNLARIDRKLEPHCKIRDKDLRFRVGELLSF